MIGSRNGISRRWTKVQGSGLRDYQEIVRGLFGGTEKVIARKEGEDSKDSKGGR